jgi:pyruvate dehydrogenase E1 component beta subunit
VAVHEAPVFSGIGAEITAAVCQRSFGYLDAPPQRLGGAWTPVPFGKVLVDEYLPSEADIAAAARRTLPRRREGDRAD